MVDCIILDTFLKEEYIDFIKLDLQGGEYHALQGMREYISRTKFLWIEYSGDYRILKFLKKNNFSLFDTNYMCLETNDKELTYLGLQKISSQILSTSKEAIIAIRNKDKNNFSYNNWLLSARKKGIVQTDLLAINKSLIGDQKELIDLMCTK